MRELCNIDSNDVENNDNSAYAGTILEELEILICRNSLDSHSNTFGHRLIESCKNSNLVILNGRVKEDQNIYKKKKLGGGLHNYVCKAVRYKTNIYSNKEDSKRKNHAEAKTKATNICKWAKEESEEFLNKISIYKVNQVKNS